MSSQHNQLRIIGGTWRSRKLSFPDVDGLRPTTDRIRETVFNWLTPLLPGAHCLDLFAGSGALGFEAASRGAEQVVMLEKHPLAYKSLVENSAKLSANNIVVHQGDAIRYLSGDAQPFDIVFLDPPFQSTLLSDVCHLLDTNSWLKPGAHIYIELPKSAADQIDIPWKQIKAKTAGQVAYALYQFDG